MVLVNDVPSLVAAVARANQQGNLTIALDDGEYLLQHHLSLKADGITIRGLSGDRDRVVLRGRGMSEGPSHIFQISGSGVTLANLTAGGVSYHVVQLHGENDADRFHAYNVRLIDAGEQIMKVSHRKGGFVSDDGLIEWSEFEFTEGYAHQAYSGGWARLGRRTGWFVTTLFETYGFGRELEASQPPSCSESRARVPWSRTTPS